jgi:hypothetical protein
MPILITIAVFFILGELFYAVPYLMLSMVTALGLAMYAIDDPIYGNYLWLWWVPIVIGVILQIYMSTRDCELEEGEEPPYWKHPNPWRDENGKLIRRP